MQGHHTPCVTQSDTGGIDRCQMARFVDGRLPTQRQSVTRIAVVKTRIQEVLPLRIVLPIERRSVRFQFTAQLTVGHIQPNMQASILITEASSSLQHVEIMLLVHLCCCTVIARIQECRCRTVFVQRCIDSSIGAKGCQPQAFAKVQRCGCPLQEIVRARGMSP